MTSPVQHPRRDVLKKAAVGGAVAWAAPVVLSGTASAGLPPAGSPPPCTFATTVVATTNCDTGEVTAFFTLTQDCPQSVVVEVDVDGTTTCSVTSGVPFFIGFLPLPSYQVTVTVRTACAGTVLDSQTPTMVGCGG